MNLVEQIEALQAEWKGYDEANELFPILAAARAQAQELEKAKGQLDIIQRECEGEGDEFLANDYGGLSWEQEKPVTTVRTIRKELAAMKEQHSADLREARAGMREACAKAIENFKFLCEQNERAYASAKRLFSQAVWDILDLAADEAIERIKREARLEEATLWSRDKFTKTHSGYCDTLESHVKECLGCQRIAALSARGQKAEEMR